MIPSDYHEPGMSQKVHSGEFPRRFVSGASLFYMKDEGVTMLRGENGQETISNRGMTACVCPFFLSSPLNSMYTYGQHL